MNLKKVIILIFCLCFISLTGCATTPSPEAAKIVTQEKTDKDIVENCKFVGEVHGVSGWGNLMAPIGIKNAKNAAREEAVSLNATHIIWDKVEGAMASSVSGKAYNCGCN